MTYDAQYTINFVEILFEKEGKHTLENYRNGYALMEFKLIIFIGGFLALIAILLCYRWYRRRQRANEVDGLLSYAAIERFDVPLRRSRGDSAQVKYIPPPWVECFDELGQSYYYNQVTGETRNKPPHVTEINGNLHNNMSI